MQRGFDLRSLCAAAVMGCLLACAGHAPPPENAGGVEADAALPAGDGWLLFRFAGGLVQRVNADFRREEDLQRPGQWLAMASPGGAFRPVQALAAGRGFYYVVDAAGGRLCLYDTASQLLSTYPLPAEARPVPGRVEVFRGANGGFTVLDYLAGEASQYADRQGGEGALDWVLRNKTKLPLGLRDCFQEPVRLGLVCRLGRDPVRFDASLNRVGASPVSAESYNWDSASGQWVLRAPGKGPEGAALFRFWPARRRLMVSPP